MSRALETLDDLIDRVAADLTRVPPDPGFGERFASRLDRAPRPARVWTMAAAATVTVVAIGLWWMPRSGPEPLVVRAGEPHVESPEALTSRDTQDVATPAVARPAPAAAAPVPRRPVLAGRARAPLRPSIPALEMPAVLALDELAVEALLVPAVDIERLDVSRLAIDGMESVPDSKEHP